MTLICILILSVISSTVHSTTPVFKEDAASKVTWKFKVKPRLDVAKFTLEWEPTQMLDNYTNVAFGINIKNGDEEFLPWIKEPKIRGGKLIYNIPRVPCFNTEIQLYAKNNEGISYFTDFENVIEASNSDAIIKSSYDVSAPKNIRINQTNEKVSVHWEESICATGYNIIFFSSYKHFTEKNTTGNKIEITELKQCEQYDISMTANIGNVKFSDEVVIDPITTPPSVQASDKLNPDVTPTAHSVHIQWDWYNTLSCISEYQIQLCHDDGHCKEPTKFDVDNSNYYIKYQSPENLHFCTKYSVMIKPIYQNKNIKEKHLEFQTLSPTMNNVTSQLEHHNINRKCEV